RRVVHLLGAGRIAEASAQARVAAAIAEKKGASSLAADMYEIVLRGDPADRFEVLTARARALDRAARYYDAAACWREIEHASRGADAIAAGLHVAASLLCSPGYGDGVRALDDVLARTGARRPPRSPARDAISIARFFAGPPPAIARRLR